MMIFFFFLDCSSEFFSYMGKRWSVELISYRSSLPTSANILFIKEHHIRIFDLLPLRSDKQWVPSPGSRFLSFSSKTVKKKKKMQFRFSSLVIGRKMISTNFNPSGKICEYRADPLLS